MESKQVMTGIIILIIGVLCFASAYIPKLSCPISTYCRGWFWFHLFGVIFAVLGLNIIFIKQKAGVISAGRLLLLGGSGIVLELAAIEFSVVSAVIIGAGFLLLMLILSVISLVYYTKTKNLSSFSAQAVVFCLSALLSVVGLMVAGSILKSTETKPKIKT